MSTEYTGNIQNVAYFNYISCLKACLASDKSDSNLNQNKPLKSNYLE